VGSLRWLRSTLSVTATVVLVALYLPAAAPEGPAGIRIVVNDRPIVFQRSPIMVRNRILVPFHDTSDPWWSITPRWLQALAASGFFDPKSAVLTVEAFQVGYPAPAPVPQDFSQPSVLLQLGSNSARLHFDMECRETTVDVEPRILNGHLMIPLRAVAEGLGVHVDWNAATRRALLHFDTWKRRSPIHRPPSVRAVPIMGQWKFDRGPNQCATCPGPWSIGLYAPVEAPLGSPIAAHFDVYNTTSMELTLPHPVVFGLSIAPQCSTIWKGTLPPLSGSFPPGAGAVFTFVWNQRDIAGRLVRPSTYEMAITAPVTIGYDANGVPREMRLTASSAQSSIGGVVHSRSIRIR
jgi:hypothetical protein